MQQFTQKLRYINCQHMFKYYAKQAMETFQQLNSSRRSIRSFSDTSVSQEILDAILHDALESPSSSNTQPYKIAVAQGETCQAIGQELTHKYQLSLKMKNMSFWKKLLFSLKHDMFVNKAYPAMLGKYPGIFQQRRLHTGVGLYKVLGIERHDRQARDEYMAKNFHFFDAPVAIWIFIEPSMKHTALVDAGIFMQTLMLSATSRGLGTCAQGALGLWDKPVAKYFDIPKGYQLLCGISLGYPTDEPVNQYRPSKIDMDTLLIPQKS